MINDYYHMLKKVSEASQKSEEELIRLVEAKRAKLSGLISREGALQIVASELGVNFEKQKVKLNELLQGIKRVNTVGKIIKLFPVREYKKDNREGKVVNLILADETNNIKIVLWDTNHISLIENASIKEGDVVEIENASLRNNEIHLTNISEIKLSNIIIENVKTESQHPVKNISELKVGENIEVRAFILQVFEPKFFEVCPECKTKTITTGEGHQCQTHGKIIPEKRVLISLVIDDGTGSIRVVLFSDQIEKLGLKLEDLESAFLIHRENLLGSEYLFQGNIRQNKLFNNLEIFISDVKKLEVDKLIEELEKTA